MAVERGRMGLQEVEKTGFELRVDVQGGVLRGQMGLAVGVARHREKVSPAVKTEFPRASSAAASAV